MRVARSLAELQQALRELQGRGPLGFVPTMGALHAGHAALLERSARENAVSALSIFVNPTQFGPNEDLSRYPRPLEKDLELARAAGTQLVFVPAVEDIYPPGFSTFVEGNHVAEPLCGARRPGHFRGVCTVVLRLLNLFQPRRAYFGEKDLQQYLVLRRMVEDLAVDVELVPCATVREADGLALSSRNVYLSSEERALAPRIYQGLRRAADAFGQGESRPQKLLDVASQGLESFRIDYLELRSLPDLGPLAEAKKPCALLVAAFLGKTRLIDNIQLK